MKDYHNGPIEYQNRKCTDVICLIVFLGLTIFLFAVGIYAWTSPNFGKLAVAYDPDGKGCGVAYPAYPYIYFASPHANSLWVTVCVSKCPVSTDTVLACHPNSVVTSCSPKNSANNSQTVQIYNTALIANTICMPTSAVLSSVVAPATSGYATKFQALAVGWKLILISIPIAIVLSIVVMILVKLTAACFIYILIFILIGVLITFGIYVWTVPVGSNFVTTSLFNSGAARAITSVFCFLLAFAVLVFMCCYRSIIRLAAKIIQISAIFVAKNCLIVLLPLVMFFVTLVLLVLWTFEALGYYSLGTAVTNCVHCYPYQHFNLSTSVYILLGVHVFYLLWIVFYMIHSSEYLITGTACGWYFQKDAPFRDSFKRFMGKNMGSVCMGSFILALIGFIKLVYTLLAPDPDKQHSGAAYYLRKCCDCLCCLCIGKLFDWLNAGAYTWINMAGDNYCSSAWSAAALRIKNPAATGVLFVLGMVFSVLIRGVITALTAFIIYMLVQNITAYKTTIHDSSLLLVVVGLLGFAVSCFFMGVYSDSMESLYMTYLMDVDAGCDGGACPEELKDFIAEAQRDDHQMPAKEDA